jgi:hypothetical protein
MYANLSEDENALLTHISRWGSDGYPIRRLAGNTQSACLPSPKWIWEYRSINGPPVVFKTKRAAVASFEAYYQVLIDRAAGRTI